MTKMLFLRELMKVTELLNELLVKMECTEMMVLTDETELTEQK